MPEINLRIVLLKSSRPRITIKSFKYFRSRKLAREAVRLYREGSYSCASREAENIAENLN